MTVKEVSEKLGLVAVSEGDYDSKTVTGCHIGDLLSFVMSKAEAGDAWITIQGNINVPAVASLTDVSMVILAEGVKLDDAAKVRAEEQGISVYASEESAFRLACLLKECL